MTVAEKTGVGGGRRFFGLSVHPPCKGTHASDAERSRAWSSVEKTGEHSGKERKQTDLFSAQKIQITAFDPVPGVKKQAFRMATRRRVAPFHCR